MIRNNSHLQRKHHKNQQTVLVNYRNALYQGQFDQQNQLREGRGIIYQSNTHHFIACNHFSSNKICEEALFFHSHSQYHYGRWKDNKPHGICIFRLNQILVITEYENGKISQGTNILFIFEKYCMGIIIETEQNNQWSIRSKSQVLLYQHMQNLIRECDFKESQMVSPSIVKFLNRQFPSNLQNSFKLRLINNQFYRYGFDQGLAIFFNDQNRVLSVGFHSKNDLIGQIGIKFSPKQNGGFIQEGIFDGIQTYSFQKDKKPHLKIGQMYSRHHLSSINFKNEFFIDPSQQHFNYFERIMEENIFKDMVNQLISHNALQNNLLIDESLDKDLHQRYQRLQFDELQAPNFKKGYIEALKSQKMKQLFEEQSSIKLADKFQDKNHYLFQTNSFDKLSQKNRLEIMKKQLHNSLSSKEFQPKIPTDRSKKSLQLQQKISIRNSIKEGSQSRRSDNFSEELLQDKKSQKLKLPNLQQRINIIIREPLPQENTYSKSRRKKKIFELSKSVRKDYSPELTASPFKSRMKSRIFDISIQQSQSKSRSKSKGKSRSAKKIFSKLEKSRQNRSPITLKPSENYLSPHLQLGFSVEKSGGSSQIANFPVTMAKQVKYQNNPRESEGIQDEGSINLRVMKKSQSKISLKQNFKMKDEQISPHRKGNHIYRKPMINGGYNEYVYEPINIKQSGNTPYIKNSSLKNLSKNKSASQLLQNPNGNLMSGKKIIEETSPFKKSKMGGYLNQQREHNPNSKYSDYKKRTGYF